MLGVGGGRAKWPPPLLIGGCSAGEGGGGGLVFLSTVDAGPGGFGGIARVIVWNAGWKCSTWCYSAASHAAQTHKVPCRCHHCRPAAQALLQRPAPWTCHIASINQRKRRKHSRRAPLAPGAAAAALPCPHRETALSLPAFPSFRGSGLLRLPVVSCMYQMRTWRAQAW